MEFLIKGQFQNNVLNVDIWLQISICSIHIEGRLPVKMLPN